MFFSIHMVCFNLQHLISGVREHVPFPGDKLSGIPGSQLVHTWCVVLPVAMTHTPTLLPDEKFTL